MDKVGRPAKLTDELKREISRIRLHHKKQWKAPDIRNELRFLLEEKQRKDVNEKGLNWEDALIRDEAERLLPGLSSIQKYLKNTKGNYDKEQEEDNPWSLSSLTNFPIPPEALPSVLEVWLRTRYEFLYFTIREAKWVSRLYPMLKDDIVGLKRVAGFYAQEELLNEVSGVSFYEFDGPKGVLNLYEEWKGTRFTQETRSRLLSRPSNH